MFRSKRIILDDLLLRFVLFSIYIYHVHSESAKQRFFVCIDWKRWYLAICANYVMTTWAPVESVPFHMNLGKNSMIKCVVKDKYEIILLTVKLEITKHQKHREENLWKNGICN